MRCTRQRARHGSVAELSDRVIACRAAVLLPPCPPRLILGALGTLDLYLNEWTYTGTQMADSLLYYPTIEFADEDWVKATLLLWDRVYRIVPAGYRPRDSAGIREAVDRGLIRNIHLEEEDTGTAADEFLTFCDSLPFVPAGLEPGSSERIHPDKIDSRLYPELDKIADYFDRDGWLRLSPAVARGYMFILSKIVAGRRGLARATSSRDSWTIDPFFAENANFDEYVYNRDSEGYFTSLLLHQVLPSDLSGVRMEQVVRFVETRQDERVAFRNVIDDFASALTDCESVDHTRTIVRDFIERLERERKQFRDSMDFWNRHAPASLFVVGLPVGLTAFGAFAVGGDPFNLYHLGASVSIGAVAAYTNFRESSGRDPKYQYRSYLIDMDRELNSKGLVPRFDRIFEEFIND